VDHFRIARERLKFAVDRHLNGENCYEEQFTRLKRGHQAKINRRLEKKRELKHNATTEEKLSEGKEDQDQKPIIE
jgi:chromosome condensin MukBEF MukE localization factor